EFLAVVHAWTTARTTAEIIEQASAMRIPVAPVGDGAIVPDFEHFRHQGVFVEGPHGFVQPRPPYRLGTMTPRPFAPAPALTERGSAPDWNPRDNATAAAATAPAPDASEARKLPLDGVRIIDFTA